MATQIRSPQFSEMLHIMTCDPNVITDSRLRCCLELARELKICLTLPVESYNKTVRKTISDLDGEKFMKMEVFCISKSTCILVQTALCTFLYSNVIMKAVASQESRSLGHPRNCSGHPNTCILHQDLTFHRLGS